MTSFADLDLADVEAVAERREELLAAVRDHAGRIAYHIARVDGGDYGQRSFSTDDGEWTVKYEAGDLEYLRFEPRGGGETYVISTQQPAEPKALAEALEDYPAFVAAYNDYVDSLAGLLDAVDASFPTVESTESVVTERDRIVETIEACCDRMAGELRRYEGTEYGTFAARIDGTRWELKWDEDGASYLRAGGSGGVYVLSQYGPPSAADVREYAPRFGGFVDAYNDHVAELELDLETITFET
ncbi:hypothetical protein KY092_16975 [Natronomonas gomsonensis]|uniref:hypothetical protein n=1 Tax=Natronomonas gomsonensis TaxID=1046043 RepID=UPI0020CA7BFC|nr:hypothetical protein [Natronomonas gomsonensis]MCY4732249.1 hypothetical protein [Natronomonas gomsonensis]